MRVSLHWNRIVQSAPSLLQQVLVLVWFPLHLIPPKPLVRVHGVRIIDHLIDACLEAGINEIYIVRGYLADQLEAISKKILHVSTNRMNIE